MKLCLGTVQFGMDYGIHGCKRPATADSIAMLEYAVGHGIQAVDTAAAYGDAELIVGSFFKLHPSVRKNILLSSKIMPNILNDIPEKSYEQAVRSSLERSLARLNTDYLDICYYHSAPYAFDPVKLEVLAGMKQAGLVHKTGISVYEPEEAAAAIESGLVDILQFPFSIFDQRMLRKGIFDKATESGVEIHTRSAFLQGLIMTSPESVPCFLQEAIPYLQRLTDFCKSSEITPLQLAFAYLKKNSSASHLVFGVHSLSQLKEDIEMFFSEMADKGILSSAAAMLDSVDRNIVIPSLWKRT